MCEMQSFIPWRQISFQDMLSDIVEEWSEMTALNSHKQPHPEGRQTFSICTPHSNIDRHINITVKQTNKTTTKTCSVLLQIHFLSEIPNLLQPRINRTFNGFGAKCLFHVSFQFEKTDYNGSEGAAN